MKILGIDPGLGRVGFGLIEAHSHNDVKALGWGVIETTPKAPIGSRLVEIHRDLTGLLEQLKPDVVAMESLFYFRNHTTLVPVAQARGVLVMLVEMAGLELFEYTPMQVKQALTGYGKAKKNEMTDAVQMRLNMEHPPKPDDAADGLAIAMTHLQFHPVIATPSLR